METVLQKKMQEVLEKTGMTLVEIARATGISKENIYKWFRGTRPSDSYVYNKLTKYLEDVLTSIPDMPLEELEASYTLMRDAGANYISQRELSYMVKVSLKQSRKPTPLISGKGAAGTVVFTNDEPELVVNRIDAPFLGEVEGVVEIVGSSMEPTFQHGCRIAIIRLLDPHILDWGMYYYIIDKNYQGMLKRIYPGPDEHSVELISDHEDQKKYPPIIRTWEQIEAIFKVKACILKY
jgi:transcriptional regulator with XRE-family HTH domain